MFDWLPTISLPQRVRSAPIRYLALPAVFALLFLGYAYLYVPTASLAFTYAGPSCIEQVTLFPDLQSQDDTNFKLAYKQKVEIGGISLASREVCADPLEPLHQGEYAIATSVQWDWLARKNYVVAVSALPNVSLESLSRPIPLAKPIELSMSAVDEIHSYSLSANSRESDCDSDDRLLRCGLEDLDLEQGETYEFALVRYFEDEAVDRVDEQEVEVLKAVRVASTSIAADEVVYAKPLEMIVEFDKPVNQVEAKLQYEGGEESKSITTETKVEESKAIVSWAEDLPREQAFSLNIEEVEAADGSSLAEPYSLNFATSGGPKVTGVNIPQAGVSQHAMVVISFDQELDQSQDVGALVSIEGGAGVPSLRDRSVVIQLRGMERCARFTLRISNGVASVHGLSGNSAWSYGSRTVCRTVETIGHSVQGRSIVAYFFGGGGTSVLYTGAIHGNELSSSYLVDHWMRELEANYDRIPQGRQIVVIPEVNPDGVANGTRTNANGVDLNRNFAVSDWQKDITDVWGNPMPGGGGAKAMSEPETQAIAKLTKRLQPRLTMSFHSIGGVIIANQAGDSTSLARIYSNLTGYRHGTGQSGEIFDYAISGTYDDWIAESLGLPSVLVELGSHTYSQFPMNKSALWEMAAR